MMNTKYSIGKIGYYILCMVLALQLVSCTEETHDTYTAAPEIKDAYIDQLDGLIDEMKNLQTNSEYGEKKGQYPTESRAILTDAIDDANRAVLLIKYQNPSPSENEKQRYVGAAKASIEKFKATVRLEDAETMPAVLFVDGRGSGASSYIDFGRSEDYVKFGDQNNQSFTIELWVKVTQGGGKDQNVFLSTYMGEDNWRNGWMMYWRNADGGIYRATWGETGGNICEPALTAPKDGEWQHYVFVYSDKGLPDDSGLRAKLYVNGQVKATEGGVGSRFYNSSNYANNNKPMTAFGRYMRSGDDLFEEGFAGYMKNIRIWKSAKNDAYIQESYKGTAEVTGRESDLVAAWNFTTKPLGTTNEVIDLTGRHTAKIIGSYKWERIVDEQ